MLEWAGLETRRCRSQAPGFEETMTGRLFLSEGSLGSWPAQLARCCVTLKITQSVPESGAPIIGRHPAKSIDI
jgi:hypothetical protein